MAQQSSSPVQLEGAPPPAPPYKALIEKAKARAAQQNRPLALEGVPRFDQLPDKNAPSPSLQSASTEGKPLLSEKTIEGLKALSDQAQRTQKREEARVEVQEETVVEKEAAPAPKLSEEEELRQSIEKRIAALDIGQHLLSGGELIQLVPIIPGKLEVRFRTVTEYEEGWVDAYIGKQQDLTNRQVLRALNECSLACYIESVNGVKWPPSIGRDGHVIPQNMDERLSRVRKFHSSIFTLLVQNMGWFVARVNKALTTEALGNG